MPQKIISVAPMMDWTDRHCRYFLRQISQHVLLYTEMITTGAILRGDKDYLLKYHPAEQPLAIQLGGSNPEDLAQCAKIAEQRGFIEINLNVGCPSDRVTQGKIGACLMAEPTLVADCASAMQEAVNIPVTVKTRIGIDELDSYEYFKSFIEKVATSGCEQFIIHARKAWLSGLSPKENREIPPLRYDVVKQLKQDFPQLAIMLNGGVTSLNEIDSHLQTVDGVMLGRVAYHNPYVLAEIDRRYYTSENNVKTREQIVSDMLPYIAKELSNGTKLNHITRHMMGLFHGQPGGRLWRRYLSENATKPSAGIEVVEAALSNVKS